MQDVLHTVRGGRRLLAAGVAAVALAAPAAAGAATYAEAVLADSPSAYYRLGEAPGSKTVADASWRGAVGSVSGGTLGVPGALTDPDTAGRNLRMSAPLPTLHDRTVELWVRNAANGTAAFPLTQTYVTRGHSRLATQTTAPSGWELYTAVRLSGTLGLFLALDGQPTALPCAAPAGAAWQHYVIAWSAERVACYVNGSGTSIERPVPAEASSAPAATLTLSANADVDELAVYSTQLSSDEAEDHYRRGIEPHSPAPGA